jgi:LmbE family N-acetylglucosaminyl deacetylase
MLGLLARLQRLSAGQERIFRFLQALSAREQSAELIAPGAEPVLVLAPHMDDEVLGCGGTLAAHAAAGATICAVYLTDGRYGAGPGTAAQPQLTQRRRDESRRAAQALGIGRQEFIDGAGNRLAYDGAAARRLRIVLEEVRPAVVYLPSFLERHPDHRATGDVLARAVDGSALDFECRSYEVWTALVPNRVADIDATLAHKRAALECYQSQLRHSDFGHFVFGLNAYRSSLVPGGGCRYAEGFLCANLDGYRKLHRAFRRACDPA